MSVARRILVTGGSGFIGSHVVDELVELGHEVVVLDSRRPAPHGDGRAGANPRAQYHRGDVTDPHAWRTAAAGADAVAHLAARVGLGVEFGDVRSYVHDNDAGTAAGLWTLHDLGFRGRLVLASSMVVYGEGRYECPVHGWVRPGPRRAVDLDAGQWEPVCPTCQRALSAAPVDEDAPVDPRNVYAATKLHQEHLCAAFGREHACTVTALRYHNVYGPRMPVDSPYAGVAAIFGSALRNGESPRLFEDGAQRRDFVHVRDVAHATVLALTNDHPVAGALNIASGMPRTIADLAAAMTDAFGGDVRPAVVGGYRLGDVRHIFASPTRADRLLGFRAAVPFPAGIAELAALSKLGTPAL